VSHPKGAYHSAYRLTEFNVQAVRPVLLILRGYCDCSDVPCWHVGYLNSHGERPSCRSAWYERRFRYHRGALSCIDDLGFKDVVIHTATHGHTWYTYLHFVQNSDHIGCLTEGWPEW